MDERKAFTVDPVLFENLGFLIDGIKKKGMRAMITSVSFFTFRKTVQNM